MKKWALILLCMVSAACVYDYDAGLPEEVSYVVLEGDIIIGDYTTVGFTRNNHPVSFKPSVEGEDGTVINPDGNSSFNGSSRLDTRSLNPNVRYRIRIHDIEDDCHYTSSWQSVMPAPVIDSLSYVIRGDEMDIRTTFHSDSDTQYYKLTYAEEWEYKSYTTSYLRYVQPGGDAPSGGEMLYPESGSNAEFFTGSIYRVEYPYPNNTCWQYSSNEGLTEAVTTGRMVSNKMVDYVFKTIPREDSRMSVKYRVKVSLRLISNESYSYWDSMDKASGQTGDLMSPIPSLMRGNIICEEYPEKLAFGYVGASAQIRKEMWLDANDLLFYHEPASIQQLLNKEALGLNEPHGVDLWDMLNRYNDGYRPWRRVSPESGGTTSETYYVWIKERCLDCTTQGGYTTKPEGWPE